MSDTRAEHSGFHPVNIAHLVAGLVLLGLAGVWALVESGTFAHDDLRWLLPVPFVAAGALGLLMAAVTGSRRYAVQQSGWVDVSDPAADDSTEEQP